MVTVDFGACLSNYWFIWLVDGLGSIFGLAINMAISYFFLKYFHNMPGSKPSPSKPSSPSKKSPKKPPSSSSKRPPSGFGSIRGVSPMLDTAKV